jgi:tetratricopeptide (TPR) repeat protein
MIVLLQVSNSALQTSDLVLLPLHRHPRPRAYSAIIDFTIRNTLPLLQMTHAWKIGKFDAAEHHYNKIHVSQLSGSASLAEKAADLYYEAGKSLAQKNLHDTAIVWLERAISALDACESEDQSQDAGELRLAITSSLGLCLCHQSLGDSTNTAQLTVYFDMAIRII